MYKSPGHMVQLVGASFLQRKSCRFDFRSGTQVGCRFDPNVRLRNINHVGKPVHGTRTKGSAERTFRELKGKFSLFPLLLSLFPLSSFSNTNKHILVFKKKKNVQECS